MASWLKKLLSRRSERDFHQASPSGPLNWYLDDLESLEYQRHKNFRNHIFYKPSLNSFINCQKVDKYFDNTKEIKSILLMTKFPTEVSEAPEKAWSYEVIKRFVERLEKQNFTAIEIKDLDKNKNINLRPPSLACLFISIFSSKEELEYIMGDLDEIYYRSILPRMKKWQADIWYWCQTLKSSRALFRRLVLRWLTGWIERVFGTSAK